MTQLAEVAHLLTHEHLRQKPEGGYAKEPALLDILRDSVSTKASESNQGGSDPTKRWPINGDALVLWEKIAGTIDQEWPGRGNPAYIRAPVTNKLNAWVVRTTDPVCEAWLLETVQKWVDQIRELLEPSKRVPLKGVTCPVCRYDRYPVEQDDEWTYKPTLVAYPELEPARVECQYPGCEPTPDNPNVWEGPDIVETFFMKGVVTGNRFVIR